MQQWSFFALVDVKDFFSHFHLPPLLADIEPENPDVEFAMAGLGSDQVDLPSIT